MMDAQKGYMTANFFVEPIEEMIRATLQDVKVNSDSQDDAMEMESGSLPEEQDDFCKQIKSVSGWTNRQFNMNQHMTVSHELKKKENEIFSSPTLGKQHL
jgi:hypothetical protein